MKKNRTYELRKRLLFTIVILAVYMAGRNLLLYNVDPAAYELEELNSDNIMISMVSGDRYQYTLFALGIVPYITTMLIMWIYAALRGAEYRARTSPRKMERIQLVMMIALSVFLAISRAGSLVFKESNLSPEVLRGIAIVEMVAGAVIVYRMVLLNGEYGIGKQMPLILVNIVDNIISTIQKYTWEDLQKPLVLCLIMGIVVMVMENVIIRIPVQRVSIHNSYADKSFMAFKLDPIGVMPVMFAVTFFLLPQLVVRFLLLLFKDNATLLTIQGKLNMSNPMGIAVYLSIIFLLNFLFSFIMLSPGDKAEGLQRGGDSIVGVYAGKKTKRYLRKKLLLLCFISGALLCLLMGTSLTLALRGEIDTELALFPATSSIFAGMGIPIYREVKAYWKFDSYSFFM